MRKNFTFFAIFAILFSIIFSGGDSWAMEFVFKDMQYSFQALRIISETAGGGADIGECLKTIYRIKEGDDESWYKEWYAVAEQREKAAEKFLASDHRLSAKKEYFRASNYYRTAEFFLHTNPNDPRMVKTWAKSRECFIKGAKLSDAPIINVEIPFEGTTLPGYLCLVDKSKKKRPLLIIQTGFDGTAEELYLEVAYAALERGYNCLIFEGPGQGRVIREQKIPFRPNWETVVTPVVNFAIKRKEVDSKKIALMGISFGGYLAPRAVAFEHRIKICIANGGVYDFHDVYMKNIQVDEKIFDDPVQAQDFDKEVYENMKKNPSVRWVMSNGMYTFQAKSPSEWIKMTRPYHMRDSADKIRSHMLIVDSEHDKDMPGQAIKLYNALKSPKEFMLFTAEEAAEEHCQVGAKVLSNERILDWLDDTMKKIK